MRILVSDYFATGEGRHIMIMVGGSSSQFEKIFGEYYAIGLEEYNSEELFNHYKSLVPKYVRKKIKKDEYVFWYGYIGSNY